ncbi:NAD(P)-binding protein, partial [Kibdelosporangium lantanae]
MTDPDELVKRCWDVVVIGSGMGGGTLGYELARLGHSVLYLEKGRHTLSAGDTIDGRYPEETFDVADLTDAEHAELLVRGGR